MQKHVSALMVAVVTGCNAHGLKTTDQKAMGRILDDVPIGRLFEPEAVFSLVGELFLNEALARDAYFIHGG